MREKRKVKFRSTAEHGTLIYGVPQASYLEPGTKVIMTFVADLSKKEQNN